MCACWLRRKLLDERSFLPCHLENCTLTVSMLHASEDKMPR